MKKKKVSITQVAQELEISASTVSRALNDLPGVSEELRSKIKSYAQSIGYLPGTATKNGSTGKQNIIGMILGDIRNPFYADLVFAVQRQLDENGYLLTVFNSRYSEQEELRYMHLAERFNFAGIIQVTVTTERMGEAMRKLSIPVVMVNRMLDSFETDVVLLDNYEAGYIATRHLIERGHSRIGFLLGQQNSSSSGLRFKGFQQAMANYNLTIEESDILQGDLTMGTAYELAKTFIHRQEELPTAMVISNDIAAHGFMSCCLEAGLEIPQMMSVVSFDNIRFSSAGTAPLTTIDAHVDDMGRIAADLMVDRIRRPNKDTDRIVLSPRLVERKSTIPYRETKRWQKPERPKEHS